ncbi:MAG TPA: XdhC family protein [Longimicrobium sp.]|jgi:xanthine/CO dehydrogenase XdhC/CoxF family maturation factor
MRDFALISDALAASAASGGSVVLATVVHTEGSTYRRAGARMLLRADGSTVGAVSGGCLEADLAARVDDLLAAGRPELVTYDTRSDEDLIWGLGLGCNGRVDVLLEPVAGDALARARDLHARCAELTAPVALSTVIAVDGEAGARIGDRLMVTEDGRTVMIGLASDAAPELVADAREALAAGRSALRAYGALVVVHEVVAPPPSLLVCGAGADAVPLATLAAGLGWRVAIVDHRPNHARADRFPGGTVSLLAGDFSEHARGIDAAVVMSHNYERDLAYVRELVAARVPYVGVLGPRRRTERLVDDLGMDAADAARLHGPVGLDIGAETSDEIALSIIAEIQAVLTGRDGGQLRTRPGAIHDDAATFEASVAPHPLGARCVV